MITETSTTGLLSWVMDMEMNGTDVSLTLILLVVYQKKRTLLWEKGNDILQGNGYLLPGKEVALSIPPFLRAHSLMKMQSILLCGSFLTPPFLPLACRATDLLETAGYSAREHSRCTSSM